MVIRLKWAREWIYVIYMFVYLYWLEQMGLIRDKLVNKLVSFVLFDVDEKALSLL